MGERTEVVVAGRGGPSLLGVFGYSWWTIPFDVTSAFNMLIGTYGEKISASLLPQVGPTSSVRR